jgi:nucleoside-triphosphatase THEP1
MKRVLVTGMSGAGKNSLLKRTGSMVVRRGRIAA